MSTTYDSDIFVAGCGIAGAAASIFANKQGYSVIQAGSTAEIVFASGLFDIYGSKKPFQSLEALETTNPLHPYTKVGGEDTFKAMKIFLDWLAECGMPFKYNDKFSSKILTPMGNTKLTWAVPESFWGGVEALEKKLPTLIVDFHGFREFSAKQIVEVAKQHWNGLSSVKLSFPAPLPTPLLPGSMAQALEFPEHLENLANAIKPHIAYAQCVGLPAILGVNDVHLRTQKLSELLGVSVFEIPTLPASVPGLRLKNIFDSFLDKGNVTINRLVRATDISPKEDGFLVTLKGTNIEEQIFVKHVILATGRFIGKGLTADRVKGVHESIMDLPVHQPASRELWHNEDLFHKDGHPVNYSGVMVNDKFNPVDKEGNIIHKNLHAVGTLLAHHDWMREKCGTGIAVSTAYAAVNAIES